MKAALSYRRDQKDTEPVGVSCFRVHEEKSRPRDNTSNNDPDEDPVTLALAVEVFNSVMNADANKPIDPVVGSKPGKDVCVAMYGHPEICPNEWSRVVWTVVGQDIHAFWFCDSEDEDDDGERHTKSGIVYSMFQPPDKKK